MKDSVKDILVTGDQSLTDIISCCKYKQCGIKLSLEKKVVKIFHKHLPNEYYRTYKTSCGTLKSINTEIDWRNFMKNYDFRTWKKRMDSILIANSYYMKDNTYKEIAEAIEKSRYLETAKKK